MRNEPISRDDHTEAWAGQRHPRWLVYAERQAWEPLLRLLASPAVGPEVGEGFRLVEGDVSLHELASTGVVRWCHPVSLVVPWERDGASALAAIEAAGLHELAWIAFATRRHGRHAVAKLGELLRSRRLRAHDARDLPRDAQVLLIAADERQLLIGVLSRAALLAARPNVDEDTENGGQANESPLSRAGAKLEHAFEWLEWQGEAVPHTGSWLELGAFPGGMTAVLARRAAAVVAVDRREAPPAFLADPRVRWLQADVGDLAVGGTSRLKEAPFDGLVCDVNGPPLHAARAAASLARTTVRDGGLIVFTVKLPHWADHPSTTRAVVATFRENGVTTLGYRHLQPNRQELTLAARKTDPSAQGHSGQGEIVTLR